jgi:predicted nucleic acid-binding protein
MPVIYGAVIDPSDQSLLLRESDTSKAYVLDTNVLIDIVAGTPLQVPTNSHVNISSLSLVELAAPNHMDVSVAEAVLNSIGVQDVVSVSREIAVIASELRKVQPLDSIDACIAATACVLDAVLVTNDGRLLRHPVVATSTFPFPLDSKDEIV